MANADEEDDDRSSQGAGVRSTDAKPSISNGKLSEMRRVGRRGGSEKDKLGSWARDRMDLVRRDVAGGGVGGAGEAGVVREKEGEASSSGKGFDSRVVDAEDWDLLARRASLWDAKATEREGRAEGGEIRGSVCVAVGTNVLRIRREVGEKEDRRELGVEGKEEDPVEESSSSSE